MWILGYNFLSVSSAASVFEPLNFGLGVDYSTIVLKPLEDSVKRLKFQFPDSKILQNTLNLQIKDWSCQGSLIKGGWFSSVDLLLPLISLAY
jgi:hypothetical protein